MAFIDWILWCLHLYKWKQRLKHEVYLHDKNIRFVIHNDIQLVYSVSLCTQMFGIGDYSSKLET